MPACRRLWTLLALAAAAAAAAAATPAPAAEPRPWMDATLPPAVRAGTLVAAMRLDEMLALVHGNGTKPYVGNVPGNARLGIPSLSLEDGPQGVADGTLNATAWPSALTVAASWDAGAMRAFGAAMGREQRAKGTNIMLGPMVNLARVPVDGRSFESMGEDPYLAARMAAASVNGTQSEGVLACVKHFVANNQELSRTLTSADVSTRALFELYYPAFRAAVRAGVGSVMCSYNRVNGTYACEQPDTLGDLKRDLGYDYFVMSDWGATHSTAAAANAGLDMEMPGDVYFGAALAAAVRDGSVPAARVRDMARRIVTPMFALGLFDRPREGNLSAVATSANHTALARSLAARGSVLLRNEGGLLPLPGAASSAPYRLAVIGDDAGAAPVATGGGSGHVVPSAGVVSPLDAIRARVAAAGAPVTVTYTPSGNASAAAAAAAAADVALVFVSQWSREGQDRANLSLGAAQDALVAAVAAAAPAGRTAVVVNTPGAVLMPWDADAGAVLVTWLPGQADGAAAADVLFGDTPPSGRLPVTFPPSETATPVGGSPRQYPGVDNEALYSEGLLIGYRWYHARGVRPAYAFGHGLAYTQFAYDSLEVRPAAARAGEDVAVSFRVTNTGKDRAGTETPQLYVGFPAAAGMPPWMLRGFAQVTLKPGESAAVTLVLRADNNDLAAFVARGQPFEPVAGQFRLFVGPSAEEQALTGSFSVSSSSS